LKWGGACNLCFGISYVSCCLSVLLYLRLSWMHIRLLIFSWSFVRLYFFFCALMY
jgi:hypothetical protein